MSQYAFLAPDFAEAHEHAARAESLAHADPPRRSFYSRFALEVIVKWLYRHDRSLKDPFETTLSARIHEPTFQTLVGQPLVAESEDRKGPRQQQRFMTPSRRVRAGRDVAARAFPPRLLACAHLWSRGAARPQLGILIDALPRTSSVPVPPICASCKKSRDATPTRSRLATSERQAARRRRSSAKSSRRKSLTLRTEVVAIKSGEREGPRSSRLRRSDDPRRLHRSVARRSRMDVPQSGVRHRIPGHEHAQHIPAKASSTSAVGRRRQAARPRRSQADAARCAASGKQQAEALRRLPRGGVGQRPIIFYTNGYEHWLWDDRRYPPRAGPGVSDTRTSWSSRSGGGRIRKPLPPQRSTPRSSSASTRPARSAASPKHSRRTTSARRCS